MSEFILCGPCGYTKENRSAEIWCTVCEEGLCADCEKVHKSIKSSRNHRLISIEDYRQIKDSSVNLDCQDHDKQLELYCKTHDIAVCLGCIPFHHMTCPDVIPLDQAAKNVKRSVALSDLKDTFSSTLHNLQQIITDCVSAMELLNDQRQDIKNTINDTRARIMKKLDDLQTKLLLELDKKYGNCKSDNDKFLTRLKNCESDLSCWRKQTKQLKSFASEVQLFLGTRQINKAVFKEIESVKEWIKYIQNYEMFLKLNPTIMLIKNDVDKLGKISVKKTTTCLSFKEAKADQAQIQLLEPNILSIKQIGIQLKKRFKVKQTSFLTWLSGCTMLRNGSVLIADYKGDNNLMEYNEEGKHIRTIKLSGSPFDISVIDSDRIAITYGSLSQYIEICNIKNNTIEKRAKLKSKCYGISYKNNNLFVVIEDGIVITNMLGKVLSKLDVECGLYLETAVDRIYFTVERNQTVNCISMTGEEIWVHKEESLVGPKGITVDNHQNVYVVDIKSKILVVIQHDGSSSKTILTKADGLDQPQTLHYSKEKNVLLLCNNHECAALYNFE
ncbi:tripartite motif-containing protein 2-like [Mytilus edulis]|uniref:tripartite motif-containing protein 2-like n=1 Tax=Mytilus edulis TaxID=6550 RepID=UPI0039F0111B